VGFVLLWVREDEFKETVKNSMNTQSMELMFDRIESVQNRIFVDPNFCNAVTRLQDCNMEELNVHVLMGHYNRTLIALSWVIEEFVNCSGIGAEPLVKYFFTGR
jgi:hypothetical protein